MFVGSLTSRISIPGFPEVVVSFAQIYRKTKRNLDGAAAEHGFTWKDPEDARKRDLAAEFFGVAAEHGMRLTLCSQESYIPDGA